MSQTNNALVKHNGESAPIPFEGPASLPPADVAEEKDGYILTMDMPGARREAISVTVVGGTLAVKAPLVRTHAAGARMLYREIPRGSYERIFTLGDGIDRESIDAQYENGVLTVRLRKSEAVKPKEITIR